MIPTGFSGVPIGCAAAWLSRLRGRGHGAVAGASEFMDQSVRGGFLPEGGGAVANDEHVDDPRFPLSFGNRQPPFPRPPGRPIGSFRGLPQKANS
jgi:hypothetical protein